MKNFKIKLTCCFLCVSCLCISGCGNKLLNLFYPQIEETENLLNDTSELKTVTMATFWEHIEGFQDKGYYYHSLNDLEQIIYEHIYMSIFNRDKEIMFPYDKESAVYAYEAIMNDHPELFFIKGYTITSYITNSGQTIYTLKLNYNRSKEEEAVSQKRIDKTVNTILSKIEFGTTDYQKIEYIYEYIINNTTYQIGSPDSNNISSIFEDQVATCGGYSKAFKYLCDKLGIECICVSGMVKASNTDHMWNQVKLNDEWYIVDATWGDLDFQNPDKIPEVRYDYLCITSDKIVETHQVDNIIPVPSCYSIECNYFYQNKLYLETFNEQLLYEILLGLKTSSKVTFMCSTKEVYDKVYNYLIRDIWIIKYFPEYTDINYSTNETAQTFSFWVL